MAVQEAQRPASELALGVHAGEVRAADGAEAVAVQQAARLAQLAAPGQVLASALVRQLIGEEADLRFGEDREVSLPGLAGRMVVNEVRWGEHRRRVLRVVIADDAALVRDGWRRCCALMASRSWGRRATRRDCTRKLRVICPTLEDVPAGRGICWRRSRVMVSCG